MLRAVTSAALLLALTAGTAPGAPPDDAVVRARMAAAVGALAREKASRTPTQRKISSQLLFALRTRRGEPAIPGVSTLQPHVDWDAAGAALVDVRADVSDGLLAAIGSLGGEVVAAHRAYDSVRARIPASAIELLAARSDVHAVRPADRHVVRKVDTSEGDVAHRADDLRAFTGSDGTGIAIGVMSNGVDSLAARQATGDLPMGITVLPGQGGTGDEGTAMLEIAHDLAPGASLLFATAIGGQPAFATNIVALEAAGADVIVDDVGYFAEAVFQDGAIAEAIDAVTAAGVLYASAGGNDGVDGVWEGDWVDSGATYTSHPLHAWDGAADFENLIEADSLQFMLKWSDPLGGSANDYDLLLFDPMGMLINAGGDFQTGTQDPIEVIGSPGDDTGNRLAVMRYSGVDRMLHLHTFGGNLAYSTRGAIYGHPGARGAIAAAATDWWFAGPPPNGVAEEFDGSESVESFNSDGPRRVHYEADGTPITPGDFSSTGGELRSKPDLTGADGVSTSTPGFAQFFGTSAAAPHIAALGALLMDEHPAASVAAIRAALESTALDIEAPGDDADSGNGIAEVVAASIALPEPGGVAMLVSGALALARLAKRRRTD